MERGIEFKEDEPARPLRLRSGPVATPAPIYAEIHADPAKPNRGLLIGILAVLSMLLLLNVAPLMPGPLGRQEWAYRVTSVSDYGLDDHLADMGDGGWELVSARRATGCGDYIFSDEACYEMIWRRQT